MPTPSPIMAMISGANTGVVTTWDRQVEHGKADGDTEQRGDDGEAHGHHRSEGQQHDDDGGEDADPLTRAGLGPGHQPDGLAADGHLVARVP